MSRFVQSFLILCLFSILCPVKTLAQITPDNTLGAENSQINSIDELRARIEGGAIRGDDLFHSFSDFNVGEGASVDFANPAGIANIFSRVTGGNVSEIFGTLGVDGAANLFLMNPNGIIFGENSAINVNGSFLATTADEINFDNGDRFSAANPNIPTLTINLPIGLGMGSNPGDIEVNGLQNNVRVEIPSFKVISGNYTSGLKVDSGKNISLFGGNINFNGGGLQTFNGGDIEVVSAGENQIIKLVRDENWFKSNFVNVSQFRDINLQNAAYIDASDETAGNVTLAGKNIILDRGSVVLSNTSLSSNNSIDLYATNLLEVKGSSENNIINVSFNKNSNTNFSTFQGKSNFYNVSLIGADLVTSSSNQISTGGEINISAKKMRVLDAGEIRTVSFSNFKGTAGNINIDAEDILVAGVNNDGLITSVINSSTGINSNGNSGNLDIFTSVLRVENGGRVKADTFSAGAGGELNLKAKQIFLNGKVNGSSTSNPIRTRTGISVSPGKNPGKGGSVNIETQELNIVNADITSSSFNEKGVGVPGSIKINAKQLKIYDGGAITAETAAGDAENIKIVAENIELRGTRGNFADFAGGISTSTRLNSFGNGGDISIITNSLKILDGSIIRAISLGSGDAGNININAQEIEISGVDRFALDPVASERVSKINTASLKTNGGNLTILSDSINLDNFGKIQATSVQGDRGGNIIIGADNLILSNQSNVTASAGGAGNGGNISIDSDVLAGLDNSDITANAVAGNGGNIEIESSYIIGLDSRNQLSPFSDITASSELGIDGTVTINSPETNTEEDTVIAAEDIKAIAGEEIREASCLNSHFEKVRVIDTGFGLPPSPYNYSYDDGLANLDNLNPNQQVKKSSRITPVDWKPGDPIVEANAIKTLPDGRQFFVAVESTSPLDSHLCTR
ncbi:MAG: filamentous hemagglutinin N-terminal domain-containing protein [Pleurocapsa minor HA4230-MV1]|jgi:filamentous hemagglutinin family protein|nr:filamentous hemagglutinin N-terminal domain-containing protein [Pleurocapsa minor HA4230-MV1]